MASQLQLDVARIVKKLLAKVTKSPTVKVGYEAEYAIFVHEDLEAFHPNGQAKFLEEPARELRFLLGGIVSSNVAKGVPFKEALRRAGNVLLEASQPLVPVATGKLKDSGFVEVQ